MSGGKRFKFTGSKIGILAAFQAPKTITGITKTNPAVVTIVGHGFEEGATLRLSSILGMTELNDELVVIENVDDDTFELADVDSTEYAAYVSGGTAELGTFSNFCELTNYNRSGGSSPEIPADSLCSDAAEFEIGLPDYGTTQLDFNFAPRTVIQTALQSAYSSGEKTAIKIELPKNGGNMIQLGFVQQTSESAGKGGLWVGTATIRNTGKRIDLA